MGDSQSFSAFGRKVRGLSDDFGPDRVRSDLDKVGAILAQEVDAAVRGDTTNQSLRGWTHRKPMPLGGHHEIAKSSTSGIFITAGTTGAMWHRGLGAMRVLESGRQSYAAGDMRQSGTRVRKKDGVTVAKRRRVKRTVAASAGKGTWTDAESRIDAKAAKVLNTNIVRGLLYKYF